MTDTTTDRTGKGGQLIDEKRMKDMAVAPGEPHDSDAKKATREKGQAPTRADDDGMAQTPKDELKDADRDEEISTRASRNRWTHPIRRRRSSLDAVRSGLALDIGLSGIAS